MTLPLLLLAVPLALGAQEPPGGGDADEPQAGHVEVEPSDDCASCHVEMTPEIHSAWFDSDHGVNNVKCFVCHGSAGSDFVKRPEPSRCLGCHGEQVESLDGAFMKGKDCFVCHEPHALSPHVASREGGEQ